MRRGVWIFRWPSDEAEAGLLLPAMGDEGAAAEHLRRAVDLDPADTEARARLAEIEAGG